MLELKTNLPERSGAYKIVQVEMDDAQYLWYSAGGHARSMVSLLEREGNRFGVYRRFEKGPFSMSQDRYAISEELPKIRTYNTIADLIDPEDEIPALAGDGYRVLGMGRVDINIDLKTASFFGRSMSYGLGIDREHLALFERLKSDWKVTVREN